MAFVNLLEKREPGGVDVGFIGVRGGFIDGETDVIVAGRVGKFVVELVQLVKT